MSATSASSSSAQGAQGTPSSDPLGTNAPAPAPPTVEQLAAVISQLEAHIARLQGQIENQTHAAGVKVPAPEKLDGTKTKVRPFLTQMRLFLRVNQRVFQLAKDQVLATGMYMKGDALEWFQPYMDEVMNVPEAQWKDETSTMFASFESFAQKLENVFGEVDEQRSAERKLQRLRQSGPVSEYYAKFRSYASKLDWANAPLCVMFYNGLKEGVKDEMAREEWPETIDGFATKAARIDERLHARQMEKKGFRENPWKPATHTRTGNQRNAKEDADAMEIDKVSTQKGKNSKGRKNFTPEQRQRFKDGVCLRCGEKGHFKNDCPENEKAKKVSRIKIGTIQSQPPCQPPWPIQSQPQWPNWPTATPAATQETPHAFLSWTACYDDACPIHRSDKEGSGWFPKRRKQSKNW